jgi:hypothetical protein
MQENTNPPSHTNAKIIKMFLHTTVTSLVFIIIILLVAAVTAAAVVVVAAGHSSTYLQFYTKRFDHIWKFVKL